jgi:hypothetical protein
MTELHIPTKESQAEFKWPFRWRNSGCDSDVSKYPLELITEEDTRAELAKVASGLKGAFLFSATETLTTLLYFQNKDD